MHQSYKPNCPWPKIHFLMFHFLAIYFLPFHISGINYLMIHFLTNNFLIFHILTIHYLTIHFLKPHCDSSPPVWVTGRHAQSQHRTTCTRRKRRSRHLHNMDVETANTPGQITCSDVVGQLQLDPLRGFLCLLCLPNCRVLDPLGHPPVPT